MPAFFYWKGKLTEGADIDKITSGIDLFPTFLALAGVEIPKNIQEIDGVDLLPLLENRNISWENRHLFFHRGRWEKGADPDSFKYEWFAIRDQRFRLINNKELYDIENDPGEIVNVIQQYPDQVTEMREAYEEWWKELRPLLVNEDVPLSPTRPFFEMYYKQEQEQGIPDWKEPNI